MKFTPAQAKNGTVHLRDGAMEYIRFGSGERILVMLPGLYEEAKDFNGTVLEFLMG